MALVKNVNPRQTAQVLMDLGVSVPFGKTIEVADDIAERLVMTEIWEFVVRPTKTETQAKTDEDTQR